MIVCANCRKEMICKKTGSYVRFGPTFSHVYPGDQFECTECGAVVNVTNDSPYHESKPCDPELTKHDVFMQ